MTVEERERLARLEERQKSMERRLDEMADDLKAIRAAVSEARGGWKTLVAVGTVAGSVGAFVAKIAPFMRVQ